MLLVTSRATRVRVRARRRGRARPRRRRGPGRGCPPRHRVRTSRRVTSPLPRTTTSGTRSGRPTSASAPACPGRRHELHARRRGRRPPQRRARSPARPARRAAQRGRPGAQHGRAARLEHLRGDVDGDVRPGLEHRADHPDRAPAARTPARRRQVRTNRSAAARASSASTSSWRPSRRAARGRAASRSSRPPPCRRARRRDVGGVRGEQVVGPRRAAAAAMLRSAASIGRSARRPDAGSRGGGPLGGEADGGVLGGLGVVDARGAGAHGQGCHVAARRGVTHGPRRARVASQGRSPPPRAGHGLCEVGRRRDRLRADAPPRRAGVPGRPVEPAAAGDEPDAAGPPWANRSAWSSASLDDGTASAAPGPAYPSAGRPARRAARPAPPGAHLPVVRRDRAASPAAACSSTPRPASPTVVPATWLPASSCRRWTILPDSHGGRPPSGTPEGALGRVAPGRDDGGADFAPLVWERDPRRPSDRPAAVLVRRPHPVTAAAAGTTPTSADPSGPPRAARPAAMHTTPATSPRPTPWRATGRDVSGEQRRSVRRVHPGRFRPYPHAAASTPS